MNTESKIKEEVRERYSNAVESGKGCCSSTCCLPEKNVTLPEGRVVQFAGYNQAELASIPADAVINSFGCGNPLAFTGIQPGEVVLDIGSGAGIDCLLAAQKVGPAGRVIGIDMTPAMISKARENARKAGASNTEFRQGDAESMPVENESADWIISNCVINLSPNKPKVFREAFRVLKPGGRLSVSDIVVEKLPWILRRSSAIYCSCVGGAISEREYLHGLREAGFVDVQVTDRIVYDRDQVLGLLGDAACGSRSSKLFKAAVGILVDRFVAGNIVSAKIVARKPSGHHV